MRRYLMLLLPAAMLMVSCGKNNGDCPEVTVTAPASEVATLKSYLDAAGITATEDARGFFYIITDAGTGDQPSSCSGVTVDYTGKFTTGTTFDTGNNVSFKLSSLITGWKEGIPLIKAGGSITLYLPPSLAYGSSGSGSIPPNAYLIFTISLKALY